MNGHHLILGEIKDFITGETLVETHDEQFRQNIAHLLVNELGYLKEDIIPRYKKNITIDDKSALIMVDFIIRFSGKTRMIIKYGPGSLITRHRMALGVSRIVEQYQIPLVVVTNGKEADILDGASGKIISSGLDKIPAKSDFIQKNINETFKTISEKQREMESRIVYAFEIDDKCPCDDTQQCIMPKLDNR